MADIISLRAKRKHKAKNNRQEKSLCRHGFHRWQVENRPFDSKKGKLVTAWRCSRCGKQRVSSQ